MGEEKATELRYVNIQRSKMRSETKNLSYTIPYLVKQILNVLSMLFYVIGGIVIFTLIPFLRDLQNPWYEMTRLSVYYLCTLFCLVNMEILFHRPTSMQARLELDISSSEPEDMSAAKVEKKEDMTMDTPEVALEPGAHEVRKPLMTESIVQEIPNQFVNWGGHHTSSLLDILQPEVKTV